MSEMFERAFKALDAVAVDEPSEDELRQYVRVIMESMREPTEEMAAVGKHALETSARGARQLTNMGHSIMTFPHLAAWRAMIDEALRDDASIGGVRR